MGQGSEGRGRYPKTRSIYHTGYTTEHMTYSFLGLRCEATIIPAPFFTELAGGG